MGSSYGCRPLRHWYVKESKQNATKEIERLKKEAQKLAPYITDYGIKVCFKVFFSMCDQKMENFKWKNTSSMRCPFCRVLQGEFHRDHDFEVKNDSLSDLCMSILHYLLRFFDHFIKVILHENSQTKILY